MDDLRYVNRPAIWDAEDDFYTPEDRLRSFCLERAEPGGYDAVADLTALLDRLAAAESRIKLLRHSHAAEIMEVERQFAAAESQREALMQAVGDLMEAFWDGEDGKIDYSRDFWELLIYLQGAYEDLLAALKEQPREPGEEG